MMKSGLREIVRLLTIMFIGISFIVSATGCSPGAYWDYYEYDSGYHKQKLKKQKHKKNKNYKKKNKKYNKESKKYNKKYKKHHHDHDDDDDDDD